ncbi:S24 family peptidase [Tenacibaculum maritimum]|uniref:S24 family peptidase n=1 Tax=Tenacibaculum maritimum TaxID=107401 RepID=UPI0012E539A0|nr:S24 family peptidase [Tenacibaculum maritimum]CAA0255081.1 hypothetical protein TMP445_80054 [Tenacibaculum maritimum]
MIVERIKEFIDFKDIKVTSFERKIGASKGVLSRSIKNKTDIQSKWASKIVENYPQINATWLLTGEGSMLKDEKEVNVRMLRTDTVIATSQHVPYYNISATASIVEAFTSEAPEIPIEHISIPNLPKCDGALNITGDSMYPLLKSGDIVMYRNVNDVSNIIWGEMYLMYLNCHGDEFFFCKYIHKAEKEGFVKLVSQNKHHEAKEFPISCIKQLAIVKASIRINSVI